MANRYPKAGADFGYNSSSGDLYDRLRDVHVFSEQALFRTIARTIEIQGTPQRVTGMVATPSLFRLLVAGQLYGVKPLDPTVLSAVVLTLAAVGMAACVVPARRDTRVDPVTVLREQ